jgi:hypothetical protein
MITFKPFMDEMGDNRKTGKALLLNIKVPL